MPICAPCSLWCLMCMLTLQHVCLFGRSLFSLTYLMLSDTNGNYNDYTTYTIYCRLLDVCQRVFSQDTGACSISDLPPYIFWGVLWTLWMLWTWRSEPKLTGNVCKGSQSEKFDSRWLLHENSRVRITLRHFGLSSLQAHPGTQWNPVFIYPYIQLYSYIHYVRVHGLWCGTLWNINNTNINTYRLTLETSSIMWCERMMGLFLMPTDPQYSRACIFTWKVIVANLLNYGNIWEHMITITTYGDIWWHMVTYCDIWLMWSHSD